MAKKQRYQNRVELLQGTLDVLILQKLQWGARHGYGISQSIRGRSGEVLFACYIPARRATKVDPMVALRYE